MWLARALVGTTWISTDILTVQCLVTPKCAGASGSKIDDDGVWMLKQTCSGQYSARTHSYINFYLTSNVSSNFS